MDFPSKQKFEWIPKSSALLTVLMIISSSVTATVIGYDGSMMNALNILPSYTDYFQLSTATLSLNTASVWMGATLAGLFFGKITDWLGRKKAMYVAAILTIFAVVLQAAAQNIAMFVVARILIGLGTGMSGLAGPVWLAETLPFKWRATGLAIFYDLFYLGKTPHLNTYIMQSNETNHTKGALISAGITYKTSFMSSTWAWRIPSAVQGVFSILCIVILPFVPESPRWLAHQGLRSEALEVVALTHADGDVTNPIVLVQYREIIDTLEYEANIGETLAVKELVKTPAARKRMNLVISVAVFSMLSGNNIVTYYLGEMLDNAGITNTTTQLEINIILNCWCLVMSILGTFLVDRVGRKGMALVATGLMIPFLFLLGALTKVYGTSSNQSGIYATVASIFLFQGSYSVGWTPLTVLYPPEVLNYSIRGNGMGVYTFFANGLGMFATFVFPFALTAIGWKLYMINAVWNMLEFAFVQYFWVETKGKTLEEIDEMLDGVKHSDVPDLERVMKAGLEVLNGVEVDTESVVDVRETLGKK